MTGIYHVTNTYKSILKTKTKRLNMLWFIRYSWTFWNDFSGEEIKVVPAEAPKARARCWNLPGISRNLPDNLPSPFKNNFEESDFVILVRSLQWLLQLQACANRNGAYEARASFERTHPLTSLRCIMVWNVQQMRLHELTLLVQF